MKQSGTQAVLPTMATVTSSELAPAQLTRAHPTTVALRNRFFCHLTRFEYLPLFSLKIPCSMMRIAGKSCSGVESIMAMLYSSCTTLTKRSSWGKLTSTTVWMSLPNAAYPSALQDRCGKVRSACHSHTKEEYAQTRTHPAPPNSSATPIMHPVRTRGNFSGSFMASVIGMTRPTPSNAKTAVLQEDKLPSALLECVHS